MISLHRRSLSSWLAVLSLQRYSYAQNANPVTQPKRGEVLFAGSTYEILWIPGKGDVISIELYADVDLSNSFSGRNCFVDDYPPECSEILRNQDNNGSFLWNIPLNAPYSDNYFLDIYVPEPGVGGPYYFMTGNFSIHRRSLTSSSTTITASTETRSPTTTGKFRTSQTGNSAVETSPVSTSDTQNSGGVSAGTAIGIVGGVLGFVVIVCVAVTFFVLLRKDKTKINKPPGVSRISIYGSAESNRYMQEPYIELNDKAAPPTLEPVNGEVASGGRLRYPDQDDPSMVASGRLATDRR